jgi:salicylate hydroxylase
MARGPVALLGDAAHPMRPYLSQGAGMALEDAWTLGLLADRYQANTDWSALFARYAAHRWARNARVQRSSLNNGRAYHARGLFRWGRNVAMKLLGERLLANHWLYSGPARPPLMSQEVV